MSFILFRFTSWPTSCRAEGTNEHVVIVLRVSKTTCLEFRVSTVPRVKETPFLSSGSNRVAVKLSDVERVRHVELRIDVEVRTTSIVWLRDKNNVAGDLHAFKDYLGTVGFVKRDCACVCVCVCVCVCFKFGPFRYH